MEHLLNPRVKNIEISGIRQFNLLAQQVPDVLALTIGEPDVPTPEHVRTAGISAIAEGRTRYTHNAGLLELRRAASAYVQQRLGVSYDPASEVIATIGATQALDIAFRT
ncbi:MAG: aminotransferase class I/II-fold pyridoxal phosphate-dependent enzyme, partial [Alicyclobacillus sp.]|nr:aminotransferase class I/II-fold pyridoxal phosphate-dependent enzyme [Alicyclobacillus sp.]